MEDRLTKEFSQLAIGVTEPVADASSDPPASVSAATRAGTTAAGEQGRVEDEFKPCHLPSSLPSTLPSFLVISTLDATVMCSTRRQWSRVRMSSSGE